MHHPRSRMRMLPSLAVLATALVPTSPATAQAPPSTDVYLAPIFETAEGVTLGKVRNLTDRDGYDNQPSFSTDGSILYYTSSDGDQTDLWAIDLGRGERRAVTRTPESEYSPTPIPGERALSTVRVEGDGKQRLWRVPLDGGEPSPILTRVEPVGYHAWHGEELVLFVLGEPHTLRRTSADRRDGDARTVASDIGRGMAAIPGQRAFAFVHRQDGETRIRRLDLDSDEITTLVPALGDGEDFAWAPDGVLWMADGTELHRWCAECGEGWEPVTDLADQGLGEITRLAVAPDGRRLALVAARPTKGAP